MCEYFITDPEERSRRKLPPLNDAYCNLMLDVKELLNKWELKIVLAGPRLSDPLGFSHNVCKALASDLDRLVLIPLTEPDNADAYASAAYDEAIVEQCNKILVDLHQQIIGLYRLIKAPITDTHRKEFAKALNAFKRGFNKALLKTGIKERKAITWLPFDKDGNVNRSPRSIEWEQEALKAMAELKDAKKQIEELQCDALMGPVLMCQVYCFVAFMQAFPRVSLAIKKKADEAIRAAVRKVHEEAIRPYVAKRIDRDQAMSVVYGVDGEILEGFKRALEMDGNKLTSKELDKARTAAMQFAVSVMHYVLNEDKEGADV